MKMKIMCAFGISCFDSILQTRLKIMSYFCNYNPRFAYLDNLWKLLCLTKWITDSALGVASTVENSITFKHGKKLELNDQSIFIQRISFPQKTSTLFFLFLSHQFLGIEAFEDNLLLWGLQVKLYSKQNGSHPITLAGRWIILRRYWEDGWLCES